MKRQTFDALFLIITIICLMCIINAYTPVDALMHIITKSIICGLISLTMLVYVVATVERVTLVVIIKDVEHATLKNYAIYTFVACIVINLLALLLLYCSLVTPNTYIALTFYYAALQAWIDAFFKLLSTIFHYFHK